MVLCDDCKQEMNEASTCTKGYIILKGKLYKRNTTHYDWNNRCHDCGIVNKFGNVHHDGCDAERCPRCGGQDIGCNCRETIHSIVGKEYVGKIPMGKPLESYYAPVKKWHGRARGRKVLELGPGENPDSRTTHSVDDIPDVKMARYEIEHNPAFKGVKHTFDIDFNKNRLPYPNNSFDLIISHGVIGAGGYIDRPGRRYTPGSKSVYPLQPAFYKELVRILKPGGVLELWVNTHNYKKQFEAAETRLLTGFGFKSVRFDMNSTRGEQRHVTYAKK